MLENQEKFMSILHEKLENKNSKYYILTMGCQLNENDSEKISGMLEKCGYTRTDDYTAADIVVFNTCCVRENAEERLFGKLGELKKVAPTVPFHNKIALMKAIMENDYVKLR